MWFHKTYWLLTSPHDLNLQALSQAVKTSRTIKRRYMVWDRSFPATVYKTLTKVRLSFVSCIPLHYSYFQSFNFFTLKILTDPSLTKHSATLVQVPVVMGSVSRHTPAPHWCKTQAWRLLSAALGSGHGSESSSSRQLDGAQISTNLKPTQAYKTLLTSHRLPSAMCESTSY